MVYPMDEGQRLLASLWIQLAAGKLLQNHGRHNDIREEARKARATGAAVCRHRMKGDENMASIPTPLCLGLKNLNLPDSKHAQCRHEDLCLPVANS